MDSWIHLLTKKSQHTVFRVCLQIRPFISYYEWDGGDNGLNVMIASWPEIALYLVRYGALQVLAAPQQIDNWK